MKSLVLWFFLFALHFCPIPVFAYKKPRFTDTTIKYAKRLFIYKNSPIGTVLLNVEATTNDDAKPVTYRLLNNGTLFQIDKYNGVVRLRDHIYNQFTVVATDSAKLLDRQYSYLNLNVIVLDSESSQLELKTAKNSIAVSEVYLYLAIRVDTFGNIATLKLFKLLQVNSIIYDDILLAYTMTKRNLKVFCDENDQSNPDAKISCDYFSIECTAMFFGLDRCLIMLKANLDSSKKANYIVTMKAVSSKNSTWASSIRFLIDIVSPKVNSAYFTNTAYVISTDTRTAVGTNMITMEVHGFDLLRNPEFVFYDPNMNFAIDVRSVNCSDTKCHGNIQLIKQLSYPTKYSLNVQFTTQNQQAATTVHVFINNIKSTEKPPIFSSLKYNVNLPQQQQNPIIYNTNISVVEAELLSIYTMGFTLDLLDPLFNQRSQLLSFMTNYGKAELDGILQVDQSVTQTSFNLIAKATLNSNIQASSYANVTINLDASPSKLSFDFAHHTYVLNKPENFNPYDHITSVHASYSHKNTSQQSFNYAIIDGNREKFFIDDRGQIYLRQVFEDLMPTYNLSIRVIDDANNSSDFTTLTIYVNTTSTRFSSFSIQIDQQNAELSGTDLKTIIPPIVNPVNSKYLLEYSIVSCKPYLSQLKINANTGKVYFDSGLDPSIPIQFNEISIKIQVAQYGFWGPYKLYLGSKTSAAIIFLNSSSMANWKSLDSNPYFLRESYSVTIDREMVLTNVALASVTAVSINNGANVFYTLLTDPMMPLSLFSIDASKGLVYANQNYSLPIGTYSLKITATDNYDNSQSTTAVRIQIVETTGNFLTCDTDYLSLKIPSNGQLVSTSTQIGSINCMSNSHFQDPEYSFSIGLPLGLYDCRGNPITKSKYVPYIGIGSKSGILYSFEALTLNKFCHAFYLIKLNKGVEFISNSSNFGNPVFIGDYISPIKIPFYAHNNAFVSNIVACDSSQNKLINNYSLDGSNTLSQYFTIDQQQGQLQLRNVDKMVKGSAIGLSENNQISINARSPNGLLSILNLTVDFSEFLLHNNNLQFDTNVSNIVSLHSNKIYNNPIYTAYASCINTPTNTQTKQCDGNIFYDLVANRNSSFIGIAKGDSENVYLTSSLAYDFQNQIKYVFIVAARTDTIRLGRLGQIAQQDVAVLLKSNFKHVHVEFESLVYNIAVLDTTPYGTVVLVVKYKVIQSGYKSPDSFVDFQIEHESSAQVERFFAIQNQPDLNIVYVYVNAPITDDNYKKAFSFVIRQKQKNPAQHMHASTLININILNTNLYSSFIQFQSPSVPNEYIVVDFLDSIGHNSMAIYTLQATSSKNLSDIEYKIVNGHIETKLFYIDQNSIQFDPLALVEDELRTDFLLYIEARDRNDYTSTPAYTTIGIQIANAPWTLNNKPYFNTTDNQSTLYFNISETISNGTVLFDLKTILTVPNNQLPIYFHLFDADPFKQVNAFTVDPRTFELVLCSQMNYSVISSYIFYVYVSTNENMVPSIPFESNYIQTHLDIIMVYINVQSINRFAPQFQNYTSIMFIEQTYEAYARIGYVWATDDDITIPNNQFDYSLQMCTFEQIGPKPVQAHVDCDMFEISQNGDIYINDMINYDSYLNGFFNLIIIANDHGTPTSLSSTMSLKAFVTPVTERAMLVMRLYSRLDLIGLLQQLKATINAEVENFYFEYVSYSLTEVPTDSYSQLNLCFYMLDLNTNKFVRFTRTRKLLSDNKHLKNIFQMYSITDIKRCNYFDNDETGSSGYYNPNGYFRINGLAIALLTLVSLMLIMALVSIISLICCWSSYMKYALVQPISINDSTPYGSSNNLLK